MFIVPPLALFQMTPERSFALPLLCGLLFLAGGCADLAERSTDARPGDAPAAVAAPAPAVLGGDVCREAGYLCAGLAQHDDPRILRWNSATKEVTVRVPPPAAAPQSEARRLQDAAVAGILAWQGKPFTLRIDRRRSADGADIVVEWVDSLGNGQLGRTETAWTRSGDGSMSMEVRRFALALRNPLVPDLQLDQAQVRLTAAHEMGHALGLPHSDSEGDVMFPTNTATSLSARDYETMAGLYRLPNGAVLSQDALPRR